MLIKDKDGVPVAKYSQTGEVVVDKKVSGKRRKFIKASAAVVPAIMTIRSGAAVAMTSINQCEERDAARAAALPESEYAVGERDEWVRMEAWKVTIGKDVSIGNPAITLYGVPDTGVVAGSVNANYSEWIDEEGSTTDKNLHPYKVNDKEFKAGEVCFLLCYVDATTGVYSWYPQKPVAIADVDASPITGSCLCSVNPDFTMG